MNLMALIGIIFGLTAALIGLLYGRKKAAQNRGLDERNTAITQHALANGWKITLVAIYVFWMLLAFDIDLTVPQVLGILLLAHMAGWAGSLLYFQVKY